MLLYVIMLLDVTMLLCYYYVIIMLLYVPQLYKLSHRGPFTPAKFPSSIHAQHIGYNFISQKFLSGTDIPHMTTFFLDFFNLPRGGGGRRGGGSACIRYQHLLISSPVYP